MESAVSDSCYLSLAAAGLARWNVSCLSLCSILGFLVTPAVRPESDKSVVRDNNFYPDNIPSRNFIGQTSLI